jgi:hypothetical protein
MAIAHFADGTQHRFGQTEIGKQRAGSLFGGRYSDLCRRDGRVFGRTRRGGRGVVQLWSSRWLGAALRHTTRAQPPQGRHGTRNEMGIRSNRMKVKLNARLLEFPRSCWHPCDEMAIAGNDELRSLP